MYKDKVEECQGNNGFVEFKEISKDEVPIVEGNEMPKENQHMEPQTRTPKLRSLRTPKLTR